MSVLLSQQAVKEAEDKKNELVMYLAHDIRTPLTTVIGYLSLLDEAPDMPSEQKAKYVGIALDKAQRLETLINELFEITRYRTASVQIKKTSIDLYVLLAQVIDEFYPTMSARGNTAKISAEDGLVINGDPEKLARVFNNLLKNAAAYSYPDTEISISAKRKGQNAVIVFQNHGQTIPEEQLANIFEKFNRLDEARLSDTGGVGLGLSIAKEIVHLHGGEIIAQSNDETVAFTITLPFSS
jgi:two-component system sensor histidine kinase VanS